MKLLILSILVAVCYAQDPPRPVIPDTFMAQMEVVLHESETISGQGMIVRAQMTNKGLEYLLTEKNETRDHLERYDMGEEYFIRGLPDEVHCEVRKTNGTTMPPYWGWVQDAKYVGQRKVREETLDVWEYQGTDVHMELLVDQENTNIPRYLNAEIGTDRRELTFVKFNAITPPDAMFFVPPIC